MSDELDQHPSLREHLGLRERVTVLEGGQVNITQALNRIEARQLTQQAPVQQHDSVILAVHDLAKSVRESRGNGGQLGSIILITLALIGVGVTAFVVGRAF
jgi:hypothetical protein